MCVVVVSSRGLIVFACVAKTVGVEVPLSLILMLTPSQVRMSSPGWIVCITMEVMLA